MEQQLGNAEALLLQSFMCAQCGDMNAEITVKSKRLEAVKKC